MKNKANNIKFVLADIRYEMPDGIFENIVWDGAIEHFTEEDINKILNNIKNRLAEKGILSGYTIVQKIDTTKSHKEHKYEFKNKEDLFRFFTPYFNNVTIFEKYILTNNSKILDVGCGKAHLIYEMKNILPDAEIIGFDISNHGIKTAPDGIKNNLHIHKAQEPYEWADNYFDFVLSLGCLHNLRIFELETALKEIERVGKSKYIMLESYRNEKELFNLQCWALTCESFFDKEEWLWIYSHFGYTGDYEFIYFE